MHDFSQIIDEEGRLFTLLYKTSITWIQKPDTEKKEGREEILKKTVPEKLRSKVLNNINQIQQTMK